MSIAQGQIVITADIINLINGIRNKIQSKIVWKRSNVPTGANWQRFDSGNLAAADGRLKAGDVISANTLMNILDELSLNWSSVRRMHYRKYFNDHSRMQLQFDQTQYAHLTNTRNSILNRTMVKKNDTITAGSFTGVLDDIYKRWEANGVIEYVENTCHSNCHDNCHGSGGWR